MISAASLQFQDCHFQHQTSTGLWRWKTRVDLSGSAPTYQVREVVAPFGLLRDTVPLPGDVVLAMAESIEHLQQQFVPAILIGPPSTITFTVDEGRGYSLPESIPVTNTGVFGSLLSTTISTSAAYVTATPSNVGNLASNETGAFEVSVTSTDLVAASSPYSATVTVTDARASNSPRTLPVTIVVRPKATIATSVPTVSFTVERPLSGPYPSVATQSFAVQNTGPADSLLDFQVQKLVNLSSSWFSGMTPVTGSLASSTSQNVTLTVAPQDGLPTGTYSETLRISGYSTNSFVDVLVQLVIT